MVKVFTFVLVLFILSNSFGQKDAEKAEKYADKAIVFMQKENPRRASKLLEKAIKFNDQKIAYYYRLAYAYHADEAYKESIGVLNHVISEKEANAMVYELLGMNYIHLNQLDEAFDSYVLGVKKFPNDGHLYAELGRLEMAKENYLAALDHFENGILMDPEHASNYYYSSKIYCSSTEEIWGLIYGEMFINIEKNTNRTEEISKLLYDTFKSEIRFHKDSSISVNICQDQNKPATGSNSLDTLSFGKDIVERNLLKSLVDIDEISPRSLNIMRNNFIAHYYQNKDENFRRHKLFEFHKKLIKHGHFEAYNYWLFMMGDLEKFKLWEQDNTSQWILFLDWFKENQFQVEKNNCFHRMHFQ